MPPKAAEREPLPPSNTAPPPRTEAPKRWGIATYTVRLHVERLVGGIPKNPALIQGWLKGRGITGGVEIETMAKEEAAKLGASAIEEAAWKGFYQDAESLFIEPRNIRGLLKQSARAIPDGGTKTIKAALKKLTDNLAISPSRIRPTRNGTVFTAPDGSEERAVHVMTPQGPRTALKRSDYVMHADLDFSLTPSHPDLKEAWLRDLLEYAAEFLGVGSDVSQDEGKFRVVSWDCTTKAA